MKETNSTTLHLVTSLQHCGDQCINCLALHGCLHGGYIYQLAPLSLPTTQAELPPSTGLDNAA